MTARSDDHRPVVPGFHPDPSVCRVADTYYLATSSFEYAPGVPIFTSTDLQTWRQIGHALDRPSQLDLSAAAASEGVFAPTLRHHDGQFWMITTNWSDDGGHLLVRASDPAGPWSDPIRITNAIGIDPDLAWDDAGHCYLTYAGFGGAGSEGIVQQLIDPETGRILTGRRQVWNGTGDKFPEGPHLYRIGRYWYLLIAEGGTERGHAVSIARSLSPTGPFESCPTNPILTHRGTDRPVQNTGHADLVQRPDGRWVMVYHGVRPRGASPEWHVLGREVFAQEVEWVDRWPVPTTQIRPAAGADDPVRDDLDGATLPPSWVGCTQFPAEFVSHSNAGWRLDATGPEPVLLARRQEHLYARIRATLSVAGAGGLTIRIDAHHAVTLECVGRRVRAIVALGDIRTVLDEITAGPDEVDLEIRVTRGSGTAFSTTRGPDRIRLGVIRTGRFIQLGSIDGRYLSTEVAGGMTGRMTGVICSSGHLTVHSLAYLGADDWHTVYPDLIDGEPEDEMVTGEDADTGTWTRSLEETMVGNHA